MSGQQSFLPIGPDAYTPEVWAALDHNRSTAPVIAVTVACLFLAILVVALRVYARRVLLDNFGLDDWFAVFSLMAVVTTGTIILVSTQHGLGTHIYDLAGPEDVVDFFKLLYAEVIVYYIALFLIKLILCAQYYRLVREVPKYRVFCRTVMGLTTAWCLASVFLMIFQCLPVQAFWDKTLLAQPGAVCHPEIFGPIASIGNIATDFILLLLPVPVILRLNLQPGQKWMVFGIFSIGSLYALISPSLPLNTAHTFANTTCSASIVSILRVALLPGIPDVTYTAAYTGCWTMAETTAGLVCPCLMTLGPLLKRLKPGLGFTSKSSDPVRARTKSHTKHSARADPPARPPGGSRTSWLGHRAWVGGGDGGLRSGSETELCRDDDGGSPATLGERSDAVSRAAGDSAGDGTQQAFELGPVSRPRTGHRRDS